MHKNGPGLAGYIFNNKYSLVVSSAALFAGSVLGSLYLVKSYGADSGAVTDALSSMLASGGGRDAFVSSLISAAQMWTILWLCASCRIGGLVSPVVVGVRSFSAAFSAAALVRVYKWTGLFAVAAGVFVQMLIVFPALQVMCAAAHNQIRERESISDRTAVRRSFASYSLFDAILFIVLVLGCMYDAYVSRALMANILL